MAARNADVAAEKAAFGAMGVVAPTAYPPSNNVQGICLIVDFSDDPWTIPAGEINNFCNQIGYTGYGNNGSVRDYYYDVSDGHLTYTNYVPPAYYRALYPKTHYETNGQKGADLIIEALTDLDNQGFDFSQYDSDHDGYVDGVNCFYAGFTHNAWSEGLWAALLWSVLRGGWRGYAEVPDLPHRR